MNTWAWAVATVSVATALFVAKFLVPHLRRPHVDEGDTPPDFTRLGAVGSLVAVAALDLAGSSVFFVEDPTKWALWLPYVAVGAPLIHVDARTTYLPNQMMFPFLALMGVGLVVTAFFAFHAAVAALIGAVAGYMVFWLIWRSGAGLGFGDVRLAAAVGTVAGTFGLTGWVWALLLSTVIGALIAVGMALARKRVFAYGPALWSGPLIAAWVPFAG